MSVFHDKQRAAAVVALASLRCLSSGCRGGSRRAVGLALSEHGVQHVDAAASKAQHGLVVTLTLGTLTVVVGARRRMLEARECCEEECALEAGVAETGGSVAANGGAGLVRSGTRPGVSGESCGGARLAAVTDLDQNACPKARSNSRQALDDARLR